MRYITPHQKYFLGLFGKYIFGVIFTTQKNLQMPKMRNYIFYYILLYI